MGANEYENMKIFTDPDYNAIVVPDEEKFIKRNESVPIVGWDEDKYVAEL